MLEIALTICSINLAGTCKDVALPYVGEGQFATPYGCMLQAQSEIAKWAEGHPNWQIKAWRCAPAGQFAKI